MKVFNLLSLIKISKSEFLINSLLNKGVDVEIVFISYTQIISASGVLGDCELLFNNNTIKIITKIVDTIIIVVNKSIIFFDNLLFWIVWEGVSEFSSSFKLNRPLLLYSIFFKNKYNF